MGVHPTSSLPLTSQATPSFFLPVALPKASLANSWSRGWERGFRRKQSCRGMGKGVLQRKDTFLKAGTSSEGTVADKRVLARDPGVRVGDGCLGWGL